MTDPLPYQTPSPVQGYLAQLKIAAIGLIASGAISFVVILVDLGFRLYNISTGRTPMAAGAHAPGYETGMQIGIYGTAVAEVLGLILTPIMVFGAVQMLRRQSYNMARAAAILAIIPFTGVCCCVLDLGFGVWALILLLRPDVKAAFTS